MIFESKFDIGDKVWVCQDDRAVELTVGKIEISHIASKGMPGESVFSNYMPQQSHEEKYMCEETGIGTGSVYRLGKNIFATQEECESAMRACRLELLVMRKER